MSTEEKEDSKIEFFADDDKWVMRIIQKENGPLIEFNTEEYPNALPDDFAEAVAKILCTSEYLDIYYKEHKEKDHESG